MKPNTMRQRITMRFIIQRHEQHLPSGTACGCGRHDHAQHEWAAHPQSTAAHHQSRIDLQRTRERVSTAASAATRTLPRACLTPLESPRRRQHGLFTASTVVEKCLFDLSGTSHFFLFPISPPTCMRLRLRMTTALCLCQRAAMTTAEAVTVADQRGGEA